MSPNKHRFVAEFHEAESAVKKYERLSSETAIPSINELRYATYHVVEAIEAEENGQDAVANEMWDRAVRHAKRAKFDVMEFLSLSAWTEWKKPRNRTLAMKHWRLR